MSTAPLACDMLALSAEKREAHRTLTRRLVSEAVSDVRELSDGLAFCFPGDEYEAVTRFVAAERLCCPFLQFSLDVAPEQGSLWLRVTGPEGVTAFIRAELHLPKE